VLGDVRWHAEERLCAYLRKRHKVRIRYFRYTRFGFPTACCMSVIDCSNFRRQPPGRGRMPRHEEHRKATYGITICTVWWRRAGEVIHEKVIEAPPDERGGNR